MKNKIVLKNKSAWQLLILILVPVLVTGQNEIPGFTKLGSTSAQLDKNQHYLTNFDGSIGGTFSVYVENDNAGYYEISTKAGPSRLNDALSYINYLPELNRFYTYGDFLFKHVGYDVNLRVFNQQGNLLFETLEIGHAPFASAVSKSGNFIFAGASYSESPENIVTLLDENGTAKWTKTLDEGSVFGVYTSEYHDYIAVAQFDKKLKIMVSFFNFKGKLVSRIEELTTFASLQFLPDKKVLIGDENSLYVYNSPEKTDLLYKLKLKGNPLGSFPYSVDPEGRWFLLVSYAPGQGYRLQAYDSRTGQILNESVFKGEPYFQPYRFANISPTGTIEFLRDNEWIKLELTN